MSEENESSISEWMDELNNALIQGYQENMIVAKNVADEAIKAIKEATKGKQCGK